MERKGSGALARGASSGHSHDQHWKVDPQLKDSNWPSTLMVVGIILGIVTYLYVGKRTLVSNEYLARSYALIGLAGTLIPMKFLAYRLGMERLEWVLFNLLAFGPIVLSAILWLNYVVHAEPNWVEHPVESVGHFNSQWRVEFTDDAFDELPGFREFDQNEPGLPHIRAVRFALARGCFGKTVLVNREVLELQL